ncbi:MAG: DUF4412 domain-containing protein [Desulfobulbaceae bacterium]|nr:DUF4412 domain-containing protein [Desulfobulbaceae bacterium]
MSRIYFIVIGLILITCTSGQAVEFSAEMVTEMNGQMRGDMYYKDSRTYRSESMGIISIVTKGKVYMLVTETRKYTVSTLDELQKDSPMAGWGDAMTIVKQNQMKKIGSEKIQGYRCDIYQGNITFSSEHPPMEMKFWYAKKLNNMLKQEAKMGPPVGTIRSYVENIKVGKQDSKLFKVPEGFTKVDSMVEAMGMPSMEMPPMGAKQGEMPSEEDMKKMMEQMQNMMKKMNN